MRGGAYDGKRAAAFFHDHFLDDRSISGYATCDVSTSATRTGSGSAGGSIRERATFAEHRKARREAAHVRRWRGGRPARRRARAPGDRRGDRVRRHARCAHAASKPERPVADRSGARHDAQRGGTTRPDGRAAPDARRRGGRAVPLAREPDAGRFEDVRPAGPSGPRRLILKTPRRASR
ncbi:hypothetical protein E2R23_04770 [Burkholderia pseudomallei]|nr:hypothetical protein [Burkholderia pseudomallei]MXQ31917.1 hypothetical protein [Burkholderia pseudomallei]QBI39257.1 hypothetical protein EXY28_04745 [Burkholderia pseudomallei]QBI45945.1 hypothetical protein EXY72_04785 [Burkholderia pseudomallei]QBL77233.1 hypothetical protein EYA82_04810 [Burkholderia pseudomallei]